MCYFENVSEITWENYITKISRNLKSNLTKYKKSGYILGLSGGIDSAVSAALAIKAVGTECIKCLILPDRDSSPDTVDDAIKIANHLGIKNIKIEDITEKLSAFGTYSLFKEFYRCPENKKADYVKKKQLSDALNGNSHNLRCIQALWSSKLRMRMMTLYVNAEIENLMVLGTTNKTEYELGWFTLYGDSAVDVEPLINLYKTRVFELAKILKLPSFIIGKKPSADIIPGIGDKDFGISIPALDNIILKLKNNISIEKISEELNISTEIIYKIKESMLNSAIKRHAPLLIDDFSIDP